MAGNETVFQQPIKYGLFWIQRESLFPVRWSKERWLWERENSRDRAERPEVRESQPGQSLQELSIRGTGQKDRSSGNGNAPPRARIYIDQSQRTSRFWKLTWDPE